MKKAVLLIILATMGLQVYAQRATVRTKKRTTKKHVIAKKKQPPSDEWQKRDINISDSILRQQLQAKRAAFITDSLATAARAVFVKDSLTIKQLQDKVALMEKKDLLARKDSLAKIALAISKDSLHIKDSLSRRDSTARKDSMDLKNKKMYFGFHAGYSTLGSGMHSFSRGVQVGFNLSRKMTVGLSVGFMNLMRDEGNIAALPLLANINYNFISKKKIAIGLDAKGGTAFTNGTSYLPNGDRKELDIPAIFQVGPSATWRIKKSKYLKLNLYYENMSLRSEYHSDTTPSLTSKDTKSIGGFGASIGFRF